MLDFVKPAAFLPEDTKKALEAAREGLKTGTVAVYKGRSSTTRARRSSRRTSSPTTRGRARSTSVKGVEGKVPRACSPLFLAAKRPRSASPAGAVPYFVSTCAGLTSTVPISKVGGVSAISARRFRARFARESFAATGLASPKPAMPMSAGSRPRPARYFATSSACRRKPPAAEPWGPFRPPRRHHP